MRRSITDIRVISSTFEEELKNKFAILRTRKHWCHWYYIRTFSPKAFLWSVNSDFTVLEYMKEQYQIVFADGYNKDSILTVGTIGVSMRVFTNSKNKTFYIAVVTRWEGEHLA